MWGQVKHDIKKGVSLVNTKKKKTRGFRLDPHTDRLLSDGAKVHGTKSNFIRVAIQNYWGIDEPRKKNGAN